VQTGQQVKIGEPLAVVHAASEQAAQAAIENLSRLIQIGPQAPAPRPVLIERLEA